MADDGTVNGEINVIVSYGEVPNLPGAGGVPSVGGGLGTKGASGATAAENRKNTRTMNDMNKWLRTIGISVSVGALIKHSKIISGTLSAFLDLIGALIDVFLMPFIPLLIPLLTGLGKIVAWFARFMVDPKAALKEAWNNFLEFLKSTAENIWDFIKNPDWSVLIKSPDWDTILKVAVGAAGLTLVAGSVTLGLKAVTALGSAISGAILATLGLGSGKAIGGVAGGVAGRVVGPVAGGVAGGGIGTAAAAGVAAAGGVAAIVVAATGAAIVGGTIGLIAWELTKGFTKNPFANAIKEKQEARKELGVMPGETFEQWNKRKWQEREQEKAQEIRKDFARVYGPSEKNIYSPDYLPGKGPSNAFPNLQDVFGFNGVKPWNTNKFSGMFNSSNNEENKPFNFPSISNSNEKDTLRDFLNQFDKMFFNRGNTQTSSPLKESNSSEFKITIAAGEGITLDYDEHQRRELLRRWDNFNLDLIE